MSKKKDDDQFGFDDNLDLFSKEWVGMPEFIMTPEIPERTIKLSFKTQKDIEDFSKLIGQPIHENIENYWFPKLNRSAFSEDVYTDET
jgi:hypothetical protein